MSVFLVHASSHPLSQNIIFIRFSKIHTCIGRGTVTAYTAISGIIRLLNLSKPFIFQRNLRNIYCYWQLGRNLDHVIQEREVPFCGFRMQLSFMTLKLHSVMKEKGFKHHGMRHVTCFQGSNFWWLLLHSFHISYSSLAVLFLLKVLT